MTTGRKMKRAVLAAVVALFVAAPAASAAPGGTWEPRFNLPDNFAIHDVMLPTGKVLTWSYPFNKTPFTGETQAGVGVASVWDPAKGTGPSAFTRVNPPDALNIWCSGQSLMEDGRVLITGGNGKYSEDINHDGDTNDPGEWFRGLDRVAIFDPWEFEAGRNPWKVLSEKMIHGRWYPTQQLLPDGRTLIFSGLDETGDHAPNGDIKNVAEIEVFDPKKLEGDQIDVIGTRATVDMPPNGAAYPHTFLMPNTGNVFLLGPRQYDSWVLKPPFPTAASPLTKTGWADVPDEPIKDRYAGTAVLDPITDDHVHHIGGSDGGGGIDDTPLASHVHNTETATTAAPHDLNIGRAHHNTVLLPDGGMATFGGGVGVANYGNGQWQAGRTPVEADLRRHVELWDPLTEVWHYGAASDEDRAYHSTALLLPDGRVFTGGDDTNGGNCQDAGQIYQPEYFDKTRPVLGLGAIPNLDYGAAYSVGTGIVKVAIMAPAAVTHSVDMNQRRAEFPVVAGKFTMTANHNLLLPGWHMVFGINAAGVPSLATWVKVGAPDSHGGARATATNPTTPTTSIEACPKPGGGIQPPAIDPPLNPGLPFTPPLVNPEVKPLPKKYGSWDLRREPLLEDCGNLDTPANEFKTLRSKRGINYYNVKQWKAGCKAAILLITDKRLKGYKTGKRTARKYKCVSKHTTNIAIGKHVHTITCTASKKRKIAWQVKI